MHTTFTVARNLFVVVIHLAAAAAAATVRSLRSRLASTHYCESHAALTEDKLITNFANCILVLVICVPYSHSRLLLLSSKFDSAYRGRCDGVRESGNGE